MDISSFDGGNVEGDVEEWWLNFAYDTIRSHIMTPGIPPEDAVVLPLPMKANIRFTNRLHTPKAFGDDAMPREFYKIPGSHHLDIWTTDKLDFDTVFNIDHPAFDTIMSIYTEAAMLPDKRLQACAGPEYTTQVDDDGFVIKNPVLSGDKDTDVGASNEEDSEGNEEDAAGGDEPPAIPVDGGDSTSSSSSNKIVGSFVAAFVLTVGMMA